MAKQSWKPWKHRYIFYLILYVIYCFVFYVIVAWIFFKKEGFNEPFDVQSSTIHGQGVFATENYEPDQELFLVVPKNDLPDDTPLNQKYKVTHLGSKVNHCSNLDKVNLHLVEKEDGWYLHSKTTIYAGDELIVDYNNNRPYFLKPAEDNWTC